MFPCGDMCFPVVKQQNFEKRSVVLLWNLS